MWCDVFNSKLTFARSNLLRFFAVQFKTTNVLKTQILLLFLNDVFCFYIIFYCHRRLYVIKIYLVKSIASQRHACIFFFFFFESNNFVKENKHCGSIFRLAHAKFKVFHISYFEHACFLQMSKFEYFYSYRILLIACSL